MTIAAWHQGSLSGPLFTFSLLFPRQCTEEGEGRLLWWLKLSCWTVKRRHYGEVFSKKEDVMLLLSHAGWASKDESFMACCLCNPASVGRWKSRKVWGISTQNYHWCTWAVNPLCCVARAMVICPGFLWLKELAGLPASACLSVSVQPKCWCFGERKEFPRPHFKYTRVNLWKQREVKELCSNCTQI